MYGKLFEKMFTGSLYGKGWGPLLVMSYVIAHGKPDKEVGMQVDLNPKEMADKFGESEEEVRKAIEFLCQPDPETTSPDEGGRRLVRLGAFSYRVVNGAKYHAMRNEEERRRQNREAQDRFREKKKLFEGLTEEEKEVLAKALAKEKKRRTKTGSMYLADLKQAGKKAGAQSVINEGLKNNERQTHQTIGA